MKITNICILIRTLSKGGAEKQSLLLANELKEKYRVVYVLQKPDVIEEEYHAFLKKKQIKYFVLSGCLLTRMYSLYKILKEFDIQLLFSYLTSDNFIAGTIGRIAGTKYIIGSIRNQVLPYHKYLINKILQKKLIDFVIFNSQSGLESHLKKGFLPEKSILILNCIELSIASPPRALCDEIRILSVGRFVRQKDYLTAFRAVRYLLKSFSPQIRIIYIVAGHGKMQSILKEWVRKYNMSGHVRIEVNPHNMDDMYRNADIFLSTSLFEGTSNSIMEAMSHSLPVVATRVGDNHLLVEEGLSGYLLPTGDFRGIANKLNELINNSELRDQFGKHGYMRLKSNYNADIFRQNYIRFIESLENTG